MDRSPVVKARSGYTILEMMVASVLLLVMVAALGTAFGTGGQVYGDGLLKAELNSSARAVLNRIVAELGETRSDAPDFGVSGNFVTYNRLETISATSATFGSERRIAWSNGGEVTLVIVDDKVSETLTENCTSLVFTLDEGRLTVAVTISGVDAKGNAVSQTVTGDVNIDR